MAERMLITKLVRHADKADLFSKGHKFRDLVLFSISDLAEVGINYESIPEGTDFPCRLWAYWEEGTKLNRLGKPYHNLVALERADQPATATSTDNTPVLVELRRIAQLLELIASERGLTLPETPADPDQDPEPDGNGHNGHDQAESQAEPLDAVFPRFQSGEAVPDAALPYYHEHVKAVGQAPADLEALRAWTKAQRNGKH